MITSGELGEPFPPERQLAELLDVSRVTIRRVLARLTAQRVIRREHGRGTFGAIGPRIRLPESLGNRNTPYLVMLTEQTGPRFNPQLTPWTWHVCQAVERKLASGGIRLEIANSERFLAAISRGRTRPRGLRGVIAPTHLWPADRTAAAINIGVPFVGLGRTSKSLYWNILDLSWTAAIAKAMRDLKPRRGDRVFIPGPPHPAELDRQEWLESVLHELCIRGVRADDVTIRPGGMFEPEGYFAMRWYLREFGVPSLVLADFDLSIIGAYRALAAASKAVHSSAKEHARVRFLGTGNMEVGRYVKPALSTLDLNFEQVARNILEMLNEQRASDSPAGLRVIAATYVARESSNFRSGLSHQ